MHTHNKEHKHHTRDITPSNMIFAIIICDSVVAPSSLSYCTVPSISQLSLSPLSLSVSLCYPILPPPPSPLPSEVDENKRVVRIVLLNTTYTHESYT